MTDSSKYSRYSFENKLLDQIIDFCVSQTKKNLKSLKDFPEFTDNAEWVCVEDGGWVGGHWVGLLWMLYKLTNDPDLESAARKWAARLAPRQFDTSTHDLGFIFELSHILGYEITGDGSFVGPALQAAESLTKRFNQHSGLFQAWGPLKASVELRGRAIVDTMMNLDLLFWASGQTGNPLYASMAETHAQNVIRYHIRPDFSTSHVVDFDPDRGDFHKQDTHQGLNGDSCWSGQSWAVYGFADCFRATGNVFFLDTAIKLAEYAISNLPSDLIPYWDYNSPDIPNDVRDSSAASILAAGLLNIASQESDPTKVANWRKHAVSILRSLWENYSSRGRIEPSILVHGTRSKLHNLSDHGLIYGDYYFIEALMMLL